MSYYVFEGIDGCGKDTQADLLTTYLRDKEDNLPFVTNAEGIPSKPLAKSVLRLNEPNDSLPTGKLLRECLKAGTYPQAHAAMFLADRLALHFTRILPSLQNGHHVVASRSLLSTLVYQQHQWPLDWLIDMHRMMPTKADTIFVLDVDPEVGLDRVGKRGLATEYYEDLDFQVQNRQRYLSLAQDPRMQPFADKVVVVDTTGKSPAEIHAEVLGHVCR